MFPAFIHRNVIKKWLKTSNISKSSLCHTLSNGCINKQTGNFSCSNSFLVTNCPYCSSVIFPYFQFNSVTSSILKNPSDYSCGSISWHFIFYFYCFENLEIVDNISIKISSGPTASSLHILTSNDLTSYFNTSSSKENQ